MAEHKYAQTLRWIADGKTVQHRLPESDSSDWTDFQLDGCACRMLIKGTLGDGWQFRIKPRTVKIGSREVEAPVLDPSAGQELWLWDDSTDRPSKSDPDLRVVRWVRDGLYFASEEACRAAHEALTALLRGEP